MSQWVRDTHFIDKRHLWYKKVAHWADEFSTDVLEEFLLIICNCLSVDHKKDDKSADRETYIRIMISLYIIKHVFPPIFVLPSQVT